MEIKDEIKKLSKEDKIIIGKMMSYLYTKSINQFELKNMHAEIVGMAAEGALRGEKLENICGPDYQKFCDDLSANCLHKTKREIILEVIMILSISFAIILPLPLLMDVLLGDPVRMNGFVMSIESRQLIGMTLVPAFCGGIGSLYYQRNAFTRQGKVLFLYFLFYMVTYFILRILSDIFIKGEIRINILLTTIVTIAIFLFSLFVKRAIAAARMKSKQQG